MPFIVDKEFGKELAQNYILLRKCKKVQSIAFFSYLISSIMIMLYSIISMTGLSWDWIAMYTGVSLMSHVAFVLIIDTIIVGPLSMYLAYRGCFLKHDLSAMLVLALQSVNYGFMIFLAVRHFFERVPVAFLAISIYSILCIVMAGLNIWANVKYHWLEDQRGFPQFSARFEEQKEEKFQRGILDPYQQEVNRLKKTSSSEMNDLGQTQEQLGQYVYEHKSSTMDEI